MAHVIPTSRGCFRPAAACCARQDGSLACPAASASLRWAQEWIYTVRPGDNLWDLTEQHLTSMRYWLKLWALNQVADPWHMLPGSRLRIPIAWLKRQPAAVKVVEVQGKAEAVLAATGQTLPVSAGRLLCSGDEVRTSPDGSVSLEFGDGSKLLLQADSRLVMDSLSAYGESGMVDTRVCLQQGRATSRVTPRRELGRPRYEISTPAAVSAVRSTQYRVSAEVERQHRRLFCVLRAVMRCRGITLAGPCGPTTWAFCYRGSAYRVWTSPRRSRDPAGPGAMRCC